MAASENKQKLTEIIANINSLLLKLLDNFGDDDIFRNQLKETYAEVVCAADLPIDRKIIIYRKYEKLILDLTYHHENQLVNDDFQNENSIDRINDILEILSEVEILCQNYKTNCISNSSSLEMCKCLLWRRGALLYMYCTTIYSNPLRLQHVIAQPHFSLYLSKGANYLKKMLTILNFNLPEDTVVCQSEDTLKLFSNGIYDSTDMLALMYAGEMYYWHATLSYQASCPSEEWHSSRHHAIQFLQKYVHLVEESIFKQTWSCERANELLQELNNIPRPT